MSLMFRALAFIFIGILPSLANAGLSILDANALNGAVPSNVASAAIKTFGIYFAHRPYNGASSMYDTNGLDFKIELTLVKIGSDLNDAMVANGQSSSSTANTLALPAAKIHFRKALSPTADIGVSGLYYMGQYAIGTDLKFVLSNPEEGITTALRFGYSYATATILYLKSVTVLSPEFVMSRKFDGAEPYLGLGGRYITGTISVPFHLPPVPDFNIPKSGSGYTAYAYTGVTFSILGPKGFRIGMEGAYDISGFSSLGMTFGVGF